ncbi:MAG TPA: CsgG/HfaB family protein [Gemmatimonadaceae bacterium]|nr:CsgG/HfaB family protein [Gemmatimonadaceae bacterium]
MRSFVRGALALVSVATLAPTIVQAQAKPVVAVLYFDNNSFGKDRADYEGLGKGIADMLINDMAGNNGVQVVERERVQALLTEQNLTKQGAVDPQTAIRLGKIIGAQYMITGGFMSDGKGTVVLTSRAINVQTSAIMNPVKLTGKSDDVLGLIAQLSTKLNTEMKLPALQVGDAGGASAQPAGAPAASMSATAPLTASTKAAESAPAPKAEAPRAEAPKAKAQAPAKQPKMDIRTAMLYSKALEEEDQGNKAAAVALYKQVVDKFPEYAPARQHYDKLSKS